MSLEPYKKRAYLALSVLCALGSLPAYALSQAATSSQPVTSFTQNKTISPSASNDQKRELVATTATITAAATTPKAENAEFDWLKVLPIVIASIALAVSAFVAVYTFRKDKRARRHSIEDDYWLRKVISPIVIEPLLKALLEMISSSPPDCGASGFSAENTKKFHDDHLEKLAQLAVHSSALSLISVELAATTSGLLDKIQELLIEYCFSNQSLSKDAEGKPTVTQASFQNSGRAELIKILQAIKSYQMDLS